MPTPTSNVAQRLSRSGRSGGGRRPCPAACPRGSLRFGLPKRGVMRELDGVEGLAWSFESGVLTLTLDRPDRLNALRWGMVEGLTGWGASAGADPDVRVIVITGAGRAFCSGDDIVGGMDGTGVDIVG